VNHTLFSKEDQLPRLCMLGQTW